MLFRSRGRYSQAGVRLERAYAEAGRLADLDPENQKIAKQKIVIGLFLVRARLGQSQTDGTEKYLADCRGLLARSDEELRDFCALTRARYARAVGVTDSSAEAYLADNRMRLGSTKRSPRWGIDFSEEAKIETGR